MLKNDIIGTLKFFSLCRPVLLSRTFISEHVALGEMFHTTVFYGILTL